MQRALVDVDGDGTAAAAAVVDIFAAAGTEGYCWPLDCCVGSGAPVDSRLATNFGREEQAVSFSPASIVRSRLSISGSRPRGYFGREEKER